MLPPSIQVLNVWNDLIFLTVPWETTVTVFQDVEQKVSWVALCAPDRAWLSPPSSQTGSVYLHEGFYQTGLLTLPYGGEWRSGSRGPLLQYRVVGNYWCVCGGHGGNGT